jgi:hypothetical protein
MPDVDKKDLQTRVSQFFDYYLRGDPPPRWMTVGIPAEQKQVDNGLAPDRTGATP